MPKYMIPVDIISAEGTQIFSVVADSPKEALSLFSEKGGELEWEDVEVTTIGTDNINVNDLWIDDV